MEIILSWIIETDRDTCFVFVIRDKHNFHFKEVVTSSIYRPMYCLVDERWTILYHR